MDALRALVVDDEEDFLETIVKRMQRRKVDVQGVESGEAALRALEACPWDVVVLDIKMPGMDGIETLREIKKRSPTVEVILLTGHGSIESGMQGMRLGAFDYVIKPPDLDELLEKMAQARERKMLHEKRIEEGLS